MDSRGSVACGSARQAARHASGPSASQTLENLVGAGAASSAEVLELQRQAGNAAVSRLMAGRPGRPVRIASRGGLGVQRKLGLPTGKEAQTHGGKAGTHIGKGKTTWAAILKRLDAFRALPDKDLAGQKTVLRELQAAMEEWVSSPKRAKAKKGDAAKEALIGELRGKVKVLYFESETKGAVLDPIAANAKGSSGANRQRIQAALLLNKLDDSKGAIDSLLGRLQAAKLTTNLQPATLAFYSKAGDFKNAFQTMYKDKSPGGALKPIPELGGANLREAAERYLGYSPFSEEQRENRPHYCGVNIFDNPKGAAKDYGRFYFVWNDAIKARATYTAFDTFKMIKDAPMKDLPREETIGTTANMEATIAFNHEVLLTLAKIDQAMAVTQKELENRMYIEAVIHGGLSMDDAAELVVDIKQNTADPLELGDKAYVDTFQAKYPAIPIRWKA